jgi:inward rectifier potassium channel
MLGSRRKSSKWDLSLAEIDPQQFKGRDAPVRIINAEGVVNVKKSLSFWQKLKLVYSDPYFTLVNSPWWRVLAFICMFYLTSWFIFAVGYYSCPGDCLGGSENLEGLRKGKSLASAFFFSVETQTTIGFGDMYPSTVYSNIVFTIQCLFGIILDAFCLGVLFAKLNRATKRASAILFSEQAVVGPRDGQECFTIRIANIRKHQIIEPKFNLYYVKTATTTEGEKYIKFEDLKTSGSERSLFLTGFPFTLFHAITPESPLSNPNWTRDGEVVIIVEGVDATTGNGMQARYSYTRKDIAMNSRFTNILSKHPNGKFTVDFTKFHAVQPIQQTSINDDFD